MFIRHSDIDVVRDVRMVLSNVSECTLLGQWREIRDIFSVLSYTNYVQFT